MIILLTHSKVLLLTHFKVLITHPKNIKKRRKREIKRNNVLLTL